MTPASRFFAPILIDADHFKEALIEYKGWNAALLHEESDYLVNMATDIAADKGLSVILPLLRKSPLRVNRNQIKG